MWQVESRIVKTEPSVLNIYSVQQHPILNYEYGTEESGTNNWALHIWVHPEANLFFCSTEQCLSQLHVNPYRWNFVSLSYDFADGKLEWEAQAHSVGNA